MKDSVASRKHHKEIAETLKECLSDLSRLQGLFAEMNG